GVEPTVIKYLDTPPDVEQLRTLISDAGLTVREAVRVKEAEFTELGLIDASDDDLLAAMVAHPRLIERPFVGTDQGTRLARPTAAVEAILRRPTAEGASRASSPLRPHPRAAGSARFWAPHPAALGWSGHLGEGGPASTRGTPLSTRSLSAWARWT